MTTPQSAQAPDSILERILAEAANSRREGRPFLAVFDLDSTLFDLHLRVAAIIDRFAADAANRRRFPHECEALQRVEIRRTDWGISEALERINLKKSERAEFYEEIHRFWAAGFFSDDFLNHDEPLPGAVEYVKALQAHGAEILYLTGRDVPRMQKGTEASLKARGFPLGEPGTELILKPAAGMDDALFKVDVLKALEKRYERIWLFENEPVNLNLVAKECPAIGLVFIDSTHSGREQVAETLDRITHFEVDLKDFARASD